MRTLVVAVERLSARIRLVLSLLIGTASGYGLAQLLPNAVLEPVEPLPFVDDNAELEVAACQQDVARLRKDKRALAEESAYLKQSVIVEQEACFGVRESLQQRQDEITELHEQLAFYRGIVSPEESKAGVRLYESDVRALGEQVFSLRLVLLQSVRRGQEARGRVTIKLDVLENGRIKTLPLNELMLEGSYSEEYRFRYYTELFAEFSLPEAVQPLRLSVALKPRGRKSTPLVRTFMWNKLLSKDTGREENE